MDDTCANCGEILRGAYCHGCGQKRFTEADRRLGHLLRQSLAVLTDLDGRLWGSLRGLFFRPGLLSRDYLDGRRRRWMSPIALFLLANVLYFVLPVGVTDFNLSLHEQLRQPVHGAMVKRLADARIQARTRAGVERWSRLPEANRPPAPRPVLLADVAEEYGARAGDVGKALVVLHVPLLALGLMACFFRVRRYFAEHLVVAMHEFTFLLLFFQLVLLPAGWLFLWLGGAPGAGQVPPWALVASLLLVGGHFALALRRVYAAPAWAAVLLPVPLLWLMMKGSELVYRPLQFLATWAIT
ncbi:MAG: hypothetical protein ABS41_04170 [Arenimonas sp. SCN 70-307]|uniref:DUF3667 domain-containing protein n=1 Tax=Arenimonas sp. SCN 70-307 TaxID=1660089 RepID=UPI000869985E|nr:DUF3667 domain-containing protein [Arenimonas sp. SCN 70-307]ODS64017.1 MAG: hypothetical protein ABS41_04170 [Arenimonas sp. SCN 70-307]